MSEIDGLNLLDLPQLIDLHRQKPSVDWMSSVDLFLADSSLADSHDEKLRAGVKEKLSTSENLKEHLSSYRKSNPRFQQALKDCYEGRTGSEAVRAEIDGFRHLKSAFVEIPLYEKSAEKEFVALASLLHMLMYFSESDRFEYNKIKEVIFGMISLLEAEDLVCGTEQSSKLFNSFLCQFKDRYCVLGKRDAESAPIPGTEQPSVTRVSANKERRLEVVRDAKKPSALQPGLLSSAGRVVEDFPPHSAQALQLRETVFKTKNDLLTHVGAKSGCLEKKSSSKLKPQCSNSKRKPLPEFALNQSGAAPLGSASEKDLNDLNMSSTTQNLLESFSRSADRDRLAQQRVVSAHEHLEEMSSHKFEAVRKEARDKLFRAISAEYSEKMARYYACKLESEIFSQCYSSVQDYKLKADECAESLQKLFRIHGTADSFMITSLDYSQIERFSRTGSEASQPGGAQQRAKHSRTGDARVDSHLSVSDDSGNQTEAMRGVCLDKTVEDDLLLNDSFENLEGITKYKEEELRAIKEQYYNLKKENSLLKTVLIDARDKLRAFSAECDAGDT